jgi:transcription termination factor Rho
MKEHEKLEQSDSANTSAEARRAKEEATSDREKEAVTIEKKAESPEQSAQVEIAPIKETKSQEAEPTSASSTEQSSYAPDGASADKQASSESTVDKPAAIEGPSERPTYQRRTYTPRQRTTTSTGTSEYRRPTTPTTERRTYQSTTYQPRHYERTEVVQPTLDEMTIQELNQQARRLGIVGSELMRKADLLEKIKFVEARPEMEMKVSGVLEKLPDGFGFLRSAAYDYVSGPDDVYVSPSQIRRFGLRTGDQVDGVIRKPKDNEKYFALLKVDSINGSEATSMPDRPQFERLTPHHPTKKFNLEWKPEEIATRLMDLFTPIGKGQRGLIVAPPKVGKTVLLKEVAQTIVANHPEAHVIVLLIDERPEEVADMRRTLRGTSAEVIASTFDESTTRHVQVADIILERAKRLVEMSKDVVIILDSITRLARAYNTEAPASGKILTGGIDANALQHPKRFFGAARATEEAGSLTILASSLVDTGSRADEVIYEEFKGTGNMEMHMTRKLSNKRIFPAFDLAMSGTRREDLLLGEDLNKVWVLQKFLSTMNINEGMEFLIDKMNRFKTNREFLDSINKRSVEMTSNPTGGGSGTSSSNGNGSHKER